jgi:hypothetical protein
MISCGLFSKFWLILDEVDQATDSKILKNFPVFRTFYVLFGWTRDVMHIEQNRTHHICLETHVPQILYGRRALEGECVPFLTLRPTPQLHSSEYYPFLTAPLVQSGMRYVSLICDQTTAAINMHLYFGERRFARVCLTLPNPATTLPSKLPTSDKNGSITATFHQVPWLNGSAASGAIPFVAVSRLDPFHCHPP